MTVRKKPHGGASLLQDPSGTSAIEFSLLLPVLILMLFGTVELHRYMLHKRHIEAAARGVANMVAQRPDAYSGSDTLSMELDLVPHMFPEVYPTDGRTDWWNSMGHQITHVVFTTTVAGCTSSCTYQANVAWTWPTYDAFSRGVLTRQCGTLTAAAPGATPTGGSIPAALFGPGSLTIVDFQYRFTPLLGTTIVPTTTIVGQGFASTRFASPYIVNQAPNYVARCPGY